MAKILIIDDDIDLLFLIETILVRAGYKPYTAEDGPKGLRLLYSHQPDLVILDLMLPRMDGWEVMRQIRQLADVPILILSARGQETDVVRGFEAGIDDYIAKPFNAKILLGRIKAIMRRTKPFVSVVGAASYCDKHLEIRPDQRKIIVRNEAVKLTPKEYRLLIFLLNNSGQVLTTQQILRHVWGWSYQDNLDYVHVFISKLRQKLEPDPKVPIYLVTEHGIGYRFERQHDEVQAVLMSGQSPSPGTAAGTADAVGSPGQNHQ